MWPRLTRAFSGGSAVRVRSRPPTLIRGVTRLWRARHPVEERGAHAEAAGGPPVGPRYETVRPAEGRPAIVTGSAGVSCPVTLAAGVSDLWSRCQSSSASQRDVTLYQYTHTARAGASNPELALSAVGTHGSPDAGSDPSGRSTRSRIDGPTATAETAGPPPDRTEVIQNRQLLGKRPRGPASAAGPPESAGRSRETGLECPAS